MFLKYFQKPSADLRTSFGILDMVLRNLDRQASSFSEPCPATNKPPRRAMDSILSHIKAPIEIFSSRLTIWSFIANRCFFFEKIAFLPKHDKTNQTGKTIQNISIHEKGTKHVEEHPGIKLAFQKSKKQNTSMILFDFGLTVAQVYFFIMLLDCFGFSNCIDLKMYFQPEVAHES